MFKTLLIMGEGIKADVKLTPPVTQTFEKAAFARVKNGLSDEEKQYFLKQVIPALKTRPQPEQFPYPAAERQHDSAKVKAKQAAAEVDAVYLRAKIMEQLLSQALELGNWLGPESFATETSEYDDWIRGVDSVLELRADQSARLAVDFTAESEPAKLWLNKLVLVQNGLDRGELAAVKYFISRPGEGRPGPLPDLPKVVVALHPDTMRELLHTKPGRLANHWSRLAVLIEIRQQLDFFLKYINDEKRLSYGQASAQRMAAPYQAARALVEQYYQMALAASPLQQRLEIKKPLTEARAIQWYRQHDGAFAALLDALG